MLNLDEYQLLIDSVIHVGALPFTSVQEYITCHYIPNWYPYISDLTSETVCFENLDELEVKLNKLGWQAFFVKDYVKSLKTSIGSRIDSAAKINLVIAEMEKYKGSIEGSICVRRIEAFDQNSEQRYFILNRVAYSNNGNGIPDVVNKCASIIPSKFFSVDTIMRTDGVLRIVEIGDGQVSDLVGWSTDNFAKLWKPQINRLLNKVYS